MKKYSIEDPNNSEYEIEIPSSLIKDIIIDYLKTTYYWPVAILSSLTGFLLGVLIK